MVCVTMTSLCELGQPRAINYIVNRPTCLLLLLLFIIIIIIAVVNDNSESVIMINDNINDIT